MIRRDYHSFNLLEALEDVNNIVSSVRLNSKTEDAEFVVGHGIIRNELIKMLTAYGLTPSVQIGNSGVIVCIIE